MSNETLVQSELVDVKVNVRVGGLYSLCGSEVFSGIEPGMVIVRGIYSWDKLDGPTQRDIESQWIDHLDSLDDNDIATQYKNESWVLFTYRSNDGELDPVLGVVISTIDWMPISLFAQHVVHWV